MSEQSESEQENNTINYDNGATEELTLDIVQTVVGSTEEYELTAGLIDQLLEKSHEAVQEGLFVAAVPDSYDLPLLKALRTRDDGKDEKMLGRLRKFSFVVSSWHDERDRITGLHRHILNERFISQDRAGYIAAHKRARQFYTDEPVANTAVQTQLLLYHGLIAEAEAESPNGLASINLLIDAFRAYSNERQRSSIERLLKTADDAQPYLELLNSPWIEQFNELRAYFHARYQQMEGDWQGSIKPLQTLRDKEMLWPSIKPFVGRAYANALANNGEFVDAISEYYQALNNISQLSKTTAITENPQAMKTLEAERGTTMIALGDAYMGLAINSRGYQESVRDNRPVQRFLDWMQTLFSFPMVIYLFVHFGWRVLHPEYWIALRGEDWIIIRLFTQSAKWYRRADPLLEEYGSPNEAVSADERLAYLMLEMQDLRQARQIFQYLLDEIEAPLGEYRRASVQVGQAETVLRLKHPGQAYVLLNEALPVLEKYEDVRLQARAHGLMGQALYFMKNIDESIDHYEIAQKLFTDQNNIVATTELFERLTDVLENKRLSRGQRNRIRDHLNKANQRQYPIRFEHPFLATFRQLALTFLALALFFIPLVVLNFSVTNGISPNIGFKPAPLLDIDGPIALNIQEGFSETGSAQATIQTNVNAFVGIAAVSLLSYLILALGVGLSVIRLTSLRSIQRQSDKGMVYIDKSGIKIGRDSESTPWSSIVALHISNLNRVLSRTPLQGSRFGLITDSGERLIINGRTSWYRSLLEKVDEYLPEEVEESSSSVNIVKQPWLWIYLITALAIWIMAINSTLSTWFSTVNLPFIHYRGRDLYPFLYLGMYLPVAWWTIIRPWASKVQLDPKSQWPWWQLAGGSFIVLLIVMTRGRPLLTVPDIYTPLTVIILLSSGSVFLWVNRDHIQFPWGKLAIWAIVLGSALGVILTTGLLARNAIAYHNYALGNHFSQTGIDDNSDYNLSRTQYESALNSYETAVALTEIPPYFSEEEAIRIPFGLPDQDTHTGISAVRARGTMYAQLGEYELAITDYENVLQITEQADLVYGWLGISYQNYGHSPDQNFTEEEERAIYELALDNYSEAISLSPKTAKYYMWRAVTHHTLNELTAAHDNYTRALEIDQEPGAEPLTELERGQAYTGLGWIDFSQGNHEEALDHFGEAVDAIEEYEEAHLGLAYAQYELKLYNLALESAEQAHELKPDASLPLIALGNINWRLGTLVMDDNSGGNDVCRESTGATEEQKLLAADYWDTAVDNLTQATDKLDQSQFDIAYTYRTRGQVNWLLRNCPNHDKADQLAQAVESYERAVENDPSNASYKQMHGRLSYALWLELPRNSENDQVLFTGYDSLWASNEQEQNNSQTETWLFDYVDAPVRDVAGSANVDEYIEARKDSRDITIADFAAACNYGFRWVSDVSIPDDTVFAPSTPFTKTWQIRNTGSCPWASGTQWVFADGAEMSAPSYVDLPETERNQIVEVSVPFVAPDEDDTYRSDWAIVSPDGAQTENTTFVRIIVSEEDGITSEAEIEEEEACIYETRFVQDVTIPDDTEIKPGEKFEKIWRIRNAGTCDWDSSVQWVYTRGDELGSVTTVPMPATAVGETADIAVTLIAPIDPGTYQSFWAIQAPDGRVSANSYYVQIVVPEEEIETEASEDLLGNTNDPFVDPVLREELDDEQLEDRPESAPPAPLPETTPSPENIGSAEENAESPDE